MREAMNAVRLLFVLVYDFALVCLCTYMVGWKGWSLWTYLLLGLLYLYKDTDCKEDKKNGSNS